MSHNYPYRRPPSDTDLRPEAGSYSSANRRRISPDFNRPPQDLFSISYPPSSSSSRGSASQDNALSILSSCGLEPSDLALLAELPEDVLTVESLPHVLQQIKGKRGTTRPFPTSSLFPPSSSSSSYLRPPPSSSGDWNRLVQYPLGHIAPSPLLSEQGRRGISRTSSSIRADPTPSSSASRYSTDFHHRSGPSDYGKTFRSAGPGSSQDRPSFSLAGQERRSHPVGFSESRSASYRSAPPSEDQKPPRPTSRHESHSSSSRSGSRHAAAAGAMPSEKAALDFHGTCPTVFPYSCSLCDITVLSEKVWTKHINGTQHAEGQLSLLQQFPNWDCRMETVGRAKSQSEKKKDEEKTPHSSQTASQNHKPQPNIKPEKKTSEKGKVVCVKFPAQSVDEAYLRKLTEPFGKIVKILMFPSLAFVELASVDQAKELVKFHVNYPPTVNGEKIEFSITNTFNFLQSSQVVSFTPGPSGEDSLSDLISIVKRFGPPLYTLFLASAAFVEMKNIPDAQKLVDYYSSNTLRINNERIKVSFSGEYKTLMRVSSAKRYEEETDSTKRTRSSSKEKEDEKTESKRSRRSSSSKDRKEEKKRSSREKQTSTRSRSRSRSRDESKEKSSRGTRPRSKSRERKTRSRSRDKSSSSRSCRKDSSREKTVEAVKTETESSIKDEPKPLRETTETQQAEETAALSAEESDIEGMEVIGEDEENVEDEDMEVQDDAEENDHQAERTDSPEEEMDVKDGNEEDMSETKKPEEEAEEATETPVENNEHEPDFPVDLENCITLDELDEEQTDEQGEDVSDEARSPSTRVVYIKDLPSTFYTDAEFIKLVKDFGKPVRYLLIRNRQEGFVEMISSSEAKRVAKELSRKPVALSGSKLTVNISNKYIRLTNGWEVQSNSEEKSQSRSSRRSERQGKSKTTDTEATCRKSEGKESSKKTPEKESGARKSPEMETANKKTKETDLSSSEKHSNARLENESGTKTSTEVSESKMAGHEESSGEQVEQADVRMALDKESGSKTKESLDKNTEEEDVRNTEGSVFTESKVSTESSEKESNSETERTPGCQLANENTSEESLMEELLDKNTEVEVLKDTAETEPGKTSRTPEKESSEDKSVEKSSSAEAPDEELPEETSEEMKLELENNVTQTEEETMDTPETEEGEEEETSEPAVNTSHQPESTGDPPKPPTEQKPEDDQHVESEEEVQVEPEKPTKSVGTEFVRPVVGYFCNLCQLIYADEDEAKVQHCSTVDHYRKYQEKTGKDPWTM